MQTASDPMWTAPGLMWTTPGVPCTTPDGTGGCGSVLLEGRVAADRRACVDPLRGNPQFIQVNEACVHEQFKRCLCRYVYPHDSALRSSSRREGRRRRPVVF